MIKSSKRLPGVAFGKKPAIIAAEMIRSALPSIRSTEYPDGPGPAPGNCFED